MTRPLTKKEMAQAIIGHMKVMVDYWANAKIDPRSAAEDGGEVYTRISGFAHSMIVMFDGCAGGIPALDIVARPHPLDEVFSREEGENYWPDGAVINGQSVQLHDLWYRK